MRFNTAAAVLSTVLLAGSVHADEQAHAEDVLADARSAAESIASDVSGTVSSVIESATTGPELPTFTVSFFAIGIVIPVDMHYQY